MTLALLQGRNDFATLRQLQNVIVLLALLLVPYGLLGWLQVSEPVRGRAGLAAVFAFTGLGHFLKPAQMRQMLPAWMPGRTPLIYATGVLELAACVGMFLPGISGLTGVALCTFLLLALPANVHAALRRVDVGGHAAGPAYLLVRVPLQLLLLTWVYWFVIR